jgi:hypothetical protein
MLISVPLLFPGNEELDGEFPFTYTVKLFAVALPPAVLSTYTIISIFAGRS